MSVLFCLSSQFFLSGQNECHSPLIGSHRSNLGGILLLSGHCFISVMLLLCIIDHNVLLFLFIFLYCE